MQRQTEPTMRSRIAQTWQMQAIETASIQWIRERKPQRGFQWRRGASNAAQIDAGTQAAVTVDAGTTEPNATPNGSDAGGNGESNPGWELGPSQSGTYLYNRLEIGGMSAGSAIAIHPDGTYALVAERTDSVHLIHLDNFSSIRFELASSNSYFFTDVRFHPQGGAALLVGHRQNGSTTEGLIVKFDDAAWRSGATETSQLFETLEAVPAALKIPALRFTADEPSLATILFVSGTSSNKLVTLRQYNLDQGSFALLGSTNTSYVEMTDLSLVKNEFGGFGVLVVGGHMGAQFKFYTEVGGAAEWRSQPGNSNAGNISHAEAHPSGDYALPISWSGDKIYRFAAGNMCSSSEALSHSITNVRSIAWQPNGARALIFGRTALSEGPVYEYRHDRFECDAQNCEVGYVPIPNFNGSPYFAQENTHLVDGAWRTNCEGGLLLTDEPAMLITFQVEGANPCWN